MLFTKKDNKKQHPQAIVYTTTLPRRGRPPPATSMKIKENSRHIILCDSVVVWK